METGEKAKMETGEKSSRKGQVYELQMPSGFGYAIMYLSKLHGRKPVGNSI
ncbi:MAG: hypothetical protein Q4F43_08960 [Eubacteriales bacterium]|nr:hypothetical protein [Eubacteriales bacterium]